MSTPNGVVESTAYEILQEGEDVLHAVNMDEAMIEIIKVEIRYYKNVPVLDRDEQPVLDEDDKPLTYRKVLTRYAYIQNFVPLPLYYEFIAMQDKFAGMSTEEQTRLMTRFVLVVWKNTEPWMTEKMLGEGLDLPVIGRLFRRFFDQNRLSRLNPKPGGSTTSE